MASRRAERFLPLSASNSSTVAAWPMSARKTLMSMSSEKRAINPYPLESDVPPLKSSLGLPACSPLKRASSVQQTQKSSSIFCWTVPSRLPAPMNKSRRSFAEAASTVANPGIIAALWGGHSDRRVLGAAVHHVGRHGHPADDADDLAAELSGSRHSSWAWLPWVRLEVVPRHRSGGGDRAQWSASTPEAREGLCAGHRGWRRHELDLAAQRRGARGFDPCRGAAGHATNRELEQRASRDVRPTACDWAPHAAI